MLDVCLGENRWSSEGNANLFAHCRVATEEDKVKRSDEIQPFIEFLFDMNYHELPMNYHKLIHSTLTPSTFGSDVGETAIGSHVSEVKVFSRLR